VNCLSTTLQCSNPVMSNLGDFQSHPCCQSCVPHTYNYLCAILVSIPIADLQEHQCLFYTVSSQPNVHGLFSTIVPIESHRNILYIIIALFYFQTQGESIRISQNICKSLLAKTTQNPTQFPFKQFKIIS
jgi:hypothetical protein